MCPPLTFFVHFGGPKGVVQCPKAMKTGKKKNKKKYIKDNQKKLRGKLQGKDRQNGKEPLHTEPTLQNRQGIEFLPIS